MNQIRPEISMEIKETNVKSSLIPIQFPHQGISHQKSAHKEKCIDRNCGVQNAMKLPCQGILEEIRVIFQSIAYNGRQLILPQLM